MRKVLQAALLLCQRIGLGIGVVDGDEILDRMDEGSDLGVTAALDLSLGQQAKLPLHLDAHSPRTNSLQCKSRLSQSQKVF